MWNKDKKLNEEGNMADSISVFAAGLTVEGDVDVVNDLRIDGSLNGNISANKKVLIGQSGQVKGNIYAREVYIMGEIIGDLEVSGLVRIGATAKVRGLIVSGEIQIDAGADVEGSLKKIGRQKKQTLDESLGKIKKFAPHLHRSG